MIILLSIIIKAWFCGVELLMGTLILDGFKINNIYILLPYYFAEIFHIYKEVQESENGIRITIQNRFLRMIVWSIFFHMLIINLESKIKICLVLVGFGMDWLLTRKNWLKGCIISVNSLCLLLSIFNHMLKVITWCIDVIMVYL